MKGMTILTTIILTCLLISSVTAIELDISSELKVSGINCSFDRELDAQTEYGYKGLNLEESYYTRYLGTDGGGPIEYHSVFQLFMGNSTEFENETTSEIVYSQTSSTVRAKQYLCAKDYELGAASGFDSRGDGMRNVELFMDPMAAEFDLKAKTDGRIILMQKVADPETHFVYVEEVTQLDGETNVLWNTAVEMSGFPEEGCDDYLACP